MSTPATPQVECERLHTTLYVSDLLAAIDFYTNKLGFSLGFTWGDHCHASYRFVEGQ